MSVATPVTVRVTRRFAASAERVFDTWLDPTKASKFLFTTATGQMVQAETDPRVGGRYTFTDRRDGVDVIHTGEYLEISRPRRLVFTFSVPLYTEVATRVAIDITPLEDGCELTLIHEGVLPEYKDRTASGWGMIFDGLAATLS